MEAKEAQGTILILASPVEKELEFLNQSLEAVVYTDSSIDSVLGDTVITVRGELPVNASVYAYPVTADNGTGEKTLAAYQIHILDEDGEIWHSSAEDGKSIVVTIYDPALAELLTDSESRKPVRGWHKEDDEVRSMAYAVREDGSVQFMAKEF